MVQTSPGAHGKLSQDAVAEGRRIAFAVARKGHDALRENFSFFLFLVVGQAELAADLIKGNRNRFDVVRPLPPVRKTARCSLHSLPTQEVLAPTHSLNGAIATADDVPVPYSIVGPEVGPNPYKPGVQCSRPDRRSAEAPSGTGW
jgi:hypothetical protein